MAIDVRGQKAAEAISRHDRLAAGTDIDQVLDDDVLAESFITGREFTVAVLGTGAAARALPVVEIVAPEGKYDYQNKYFTDDVQIEMGRGTSPIEGRPMLIGMAARLQPRLASYKLELDDIGVTLLNGETAADVRLTARFTTRPVAYGQASVDARELALGMERTEDTWRIAKLSIVEALR